MGEFSRYRSLLSDLPCGRLGVALALAVALFGCSSEEYDQRLGVTLRQARTATPFVGLWQQTTSLGDGEVTLRVPRQIAKGERSFAFDTASADPVNADEPLAADRVVPSFLRLEGHMVTYESLLPLVDRTGKTRLWPLYFSVFVFAQRDEAGSGDDASGDSASAERDAAALRDRVRKELSDVFGERRPVPRNAAPDQDASSMIGVEAEWQAMSLPTPKSLEQRVDWHRLLAGGEQRFYRYVSQDGGKVAKASRRVGDMILWHRYFPPEEILGPVEGGEQAAITSGRHVVLLFRAPFGITRSTGLVELSAAVAGTVEVHQPPVAEVVDAPEAASEAK